MKYILAVVAVMLILTGSGWAQPDTLWTRLDSLSSPGYSYVVQENRDHSFVIAGSEDFPSHCALVKAGSTGARLWKQSLGPENSSIADLAVLTDGYLCVARGGAAGALFLKTDTAGAQSWSQTFNHNSPTFSRMAKLSSGDYVIAGHQIFAGRNAAYFIRASATGNVVWEKTLFGGRDSSISITLDALCGTNDGGFIGAGISDTVDAVIDENFFVVRVNSDGDTLWTRRFGNMDRQFARSVQNTGYGYVIGGIDNQGSVVYPHIFKLDENGSMQWDRVITTLGSVGVVAAYEIEQGDLILGGTAYAGAGSPDFYVARVALNDSVRWMRRYGGSGQEWAEDMKLTSDGGCIITGRTSSFGATQWDAYTVRTTAVHNPNDVPSFLSPYPSALSLSSYPNPFNASAQIEFTLETVQHVKLKVYDVLGKQVSVLTDGVLPQGTHTVTFDGSALPSGIYFARLEAGQTIQTRKMVLLK